MEPGGVPGVTGGTAQVALHKEKLETNLFLLNFRGLISQLKN